MYCWLVTTIRDDRRGLALSMEWQKKKQLKRRAYWGVSPVFLSKCNLTFNKTYGQKGQFIELMKLFVKNIQCTFIFLMNIYSGIILSLHKICKKIMQSVFLYIPSANFPSGPVINILHYYCTFMWKLRHWHWHMTVHFLTKL